jgi:Uma2 family endonuclease
MEPEIHFLDPAAPNGFHAIDPDLAGWRRKRMQELPDEAYFSLQPDWVCEVLSKSTAELDRETKMPLYAAHSVRWAWLIDPILRTLEVYVFGEDRRWSEPIVYRDASHVRAVPFELKELDLSVLWA